MLSPVDSGEKKTIKINDFKVSPELHAAIVRTAAASHRKLMDQVRHLIEQGLRVEEGTDVSARMTALEQRLLELEHERGSPHKTKGTANTG